MVKSEKRLFSNQSGQCGDGFVVFVTRFCLSSGVPLSSVVGAGEDGLSCGGWSGTVLVGGGDLPSVAVAVSDAELGGSSRGDGVLVDLRVSEGDGEGVCGEADGEVDGVAVCGVRGEVSVGAGVLFAVYAVFGGGRAHVEGGGAPEKGESFGGEVGGNRTGDDGGVRGGVDCAKASAAGRRPARRRRRAGMGGAFRNLKVR